MPKNYQKGIKKITNIKTKLPQSFKDLFWSYNFSKIDLRENKERIIINTINYGDWFHWQWVFNYYGIKKVKKIIENIPASEFRKRSLKLACLLLNIKLMKYASRGAKIKAKTSV